MRFGGHDALAAIDLDLAAGSVVAILGGNGAGKTTLLHLIAGAIEPTAGRMAWCAPAGRGRVALVAQAVALYPFLTVRENCLAAGRMEGLRGRVLAARADVAIAQTLAGAARDRPVGQLSGGTQRRAAIAAALMGDAPLVVLDEPTTGLDAEARGAIVAIGRALRDQGKTVALATHDFALADAMADVAVFLRDGRITAKGEPTTLCRAAFGDARHVALTTVGTPTAAQAALLASLGAEPVAPDGFALFSPLDPNGLPVALPRLREAGVGLREVRIAEPGTAELFRRHCGGREAS